MIDQLDQILTDMLNDQDVPKELLNADVSFDIPKEGYAPQTDTVNLYLYNIHENIKLRDPAPILKIVDGNYEKQKPPLRMDCSYMLTAWSTQTHETAIASEHKILSQALVWLSRFPEVPFKFLLSDWKDKTLDTFQPFPVYLSVAQQNGVNEPGEFWAALGTPPRPYINLVVTIAMNMQILKATELGPPVSERIIKTGIRQKNENNIIPKTEEIINKKEQ